MKKKLALLLAGAMTLSSLPVNAFASNANAPRNAAVRLSRSPIPAPNKTAFVESSVTGPSGVTSGEVTGNNDVEHWMQGMDLNIFIEDTRTFTSKDQFQFQVELTNAEWYFGGGNGVPSPTVPSQFYGWNNDTRTLTRRDNNAALLDYSLEVSRANPSLATVRVTARDLAAEGVTPTPAQLTQAQTSLRNATPVFAADEDLATAINNAGVTAPQTLATAITDLTNLRAQAEGIKIDEDAVSVSAEVRAEVLLLIDSTRNVVNFINSNEILTTAVSLVAFNEAAGTFTTAGNAATPEQAEKVIEEALKFPTTLLTAASLGTSATAFGTAGNEFIRNAEARALNAIDISNNSPFATARTAINNADAQLLELYNARETSDETKAFITTARNAITNANGALDNIANIIGTSSASRLAINAGLETTRAQLVIATTAVDNAIRQFTGTGNGNGTPSFGVRANDVVRIPLVVRTTGENVDASVRVINAVGQPVNNESRVFASATEGGVTNTRVHNPQTSRTELTPAIGIMENRIGALPAHGAFELVAPSGFQFVDRAVSEARVTPEGGVSAGSNFRTWVSLPNNNNTVLRIEYIGLNRSTNLRGSLALSGIRIVPTNVDTVREGDVRLSIRSFTGNNAASGTYAPAVTGQTVTSQTFTAGTIADWNVNLSVIGDVPQLVNGRLDGVERTSVDNNSHKAATVRFQESVGNAWWAQRTTTFTLPEEVRVRKVEFREIRNLTAESRQELESGPFYNDRNRSAGSSVRVNDNTVTLSNLRTLGDNNNNNNNRASFEMDLWLNIESGFTGDIGLTVGGSALTNENSENKPVVIARAINPIRIETEVTNVRVGYQFVPVGNFRIIETVPGALKQGEPVFISVTDDTFSDMYIASGFDAKVTNGDLRIRGMRTGTNLNINNNNNRNNVNVSFEVERASTQASTIEFTNVQVRMSNNAPISNQDAGYDLVVWGPAVAANFEGVRPTNDRNVDRDSDRYINSNDFFRTAGIRANYINVGTSNRLTNIVRVTEGSNVIVVGDKELTMDTAAYVSQASDSMMVPVRFVSQALGIPESRVMWAPETSTVTINTGDIILQFQTNSSVMRVNGIEFPIQNARGEAVQSEVRDDRAFIPFRALGDALNIHVEWEAETSTAIFDPTRPVQSSLFAA